MGEVVSGGRTLSRYRKSALIVIIVLVAALAVGLAIGLAIVRHREDSPYLRPAGIPASVSTQLADMMQLSSLPTSSAPGFTLTDQAGRAMSLASFRGRVVVLEFMDPHCTDICPIVSQEFVDAYHDLGSEASRVVFAAVNVNQYHIQVADVAAFSREHRLTTIPSWHFFTGPVPRLRAVWRAYGVTVEAPSPSADVVHTSDLYFIDSQGHERYLAAPAVDHTAKGSAYLPADQLTAWGHGITLVVRHLLAGRGSH